MEDIDTVEPVTVATEVYHSTSWATLDSRAMEEFEFT